MHTLPLPDKLKKMILSQTIHIFFVTLIYTLQARAAFFDPLHRVYSPSPRPPILDLRTSGRIFPVLDQGNCNFCFISAPLTSFEYWAGTRLSLGHVLNCARSGSCRRGGEVSRVMKWAEGNGVPLYDGKSITESQCMPSTGPVWFELQTFAHEFDVSSSTLEEYLWRYGPVVTNIRLDRLASEDGNIDESSCEKRSNMHHSVAIVGYTGDHFIVKNSWGSKWGQNGYGKISKKTRACGFMKQIWYVKLASLRT